MDRGQLYLYICLSFNYDNGMGVNDLMLCFLQTQFEIVYNCYGAVMAPQYFTFVVTS